MACLTKYKFFSVGRKLGFMDVNYITMIFEVSMFTQVYAKEVAQFKAGGEKKDALENKISNSAHFLKQYAMHHLLSARVGGARPHFIHLSRIILQTMKSVYIRLSQDEEKLKGCKECAEDQKINGNDRQFIMGVIVFIEYGLETVDLGDCPDPAPCFEKFYKKNEKAIQTRVKALAH